MIGCGGVGISVVQGCRIAKAGKVVAVDINPQKRKLAEKFGATHSVDPSEVDLGEYLSKIKDGRGADYAFEVVGNPKLQRQAYDVTRPPQTIAGRRTLQLLASRFDTQTMNIRIRQRINNIV